MASDEQKLSFSDQVGPQTGTGFALPEREEKILAFWEREKIFEKSLNKNGSKRSTLNAKRFVFYEGPPTANAAPGIHHVEARAFKDVIPRYKTMRGFFVPRKAGWDTHGLPVELQVEKELGFKTKREIEKFGIGKFNEKCREAVWRHKEEWERLTKRIGFWLDLVHPYITYETSYIETLWWIIKEFWKKKLLHKDFKIIPWCPRCQTGLSSHELGQPGAYKKVKENSIFVRFPLRDKKNESLLIWTTTPWTLPANVAVAIHPHLEYTKFKIGNEYVWSATVPPYDAKSDAPEIVERVSGKALVGVAYEPPYQVKSEVRNAKLERKSGDFEFRISNFDIPYKVVAADFVAIDEGTGFVHLAPAFGEEDMHTIKSKFQNPNIKAGVNYPILETVNLDGTMKKGIVGEGKFVKDADPVVIEDLKKQKLLFAVVPHEHDYPHCWRCAAPLLYYARDSWWVKTTAVKERLMKSNQSIRWVPEHIRDGRFGEFLRDLRDWAFSRERYWGTPLPIWECGACKKAEAIGSLAEFAERAPKSGNTYFAMRHGEAETQLLGIAADSNSNYHLTDRGKKQVHAAAEKLKKEKIDVVIHSDVLRTTEAAHIAADVLRVSKVVKDERVREINVGVFNEKPVKAYRGFCVSIDECFEKAPSEGESLSDLQSRVMDFIRDCEQKYRNKKILIVSHEYPIWILDGASRGLDRAGIIRLHEKKDYYIGLGGVMRIPYLALPRDARGEVNLHRPFVDSIHILCKKCGGKMTRVPEVADVWFDSGAMPFAQAHYPFAHHKLPVTGNRFLYPADYIAEAVDQTRGWFYTLLAVATLLGKKAPYQHVISLGHVLDKNGQKMSKSKGNVIDPWEMIKKYGADTIRWYFYTVNPPGEPKRFDEKDLLQKQRGPLATLWNSFIFFDTYTDKIRNSKSLKRRAQRVTAGIRNSQNVLDRWVLARLREEVAAVTKHLDDYDVVGAARRLEGFIVDDFSTWYLQVSRRRFQKPESEKEKREAVMTAGEVLDTLLVLIAPFTPFLAEIIYQELKKKTGAKEASIHLRAWPEKEKSAPASFLVRDMRKAKEFTTLALAERAKAGIKVRQPLRLFEVPENEWGPKRPLGQYQEYFGIIRSRANVKEVRFGPKRFLDTVITEELREEGHLRELVRNVQEMRKNLGLRPQHHIRLQVVSGKEFSAAVDRWKEFLKKETGATMVQVGGKKVFKAERELSLDGHEVWVGIGKM